MIEKQSYDIAYFDGGDIPPDPEAEYDRVVELGKSNGPVVQEWLLRLQTELSERRRVTEEKRKMSELAPFRAEYEGLEEVGRLRETLRVYKELRQLEASIQRLEGIQNRGGSKGYEGDLYEDLRTMKTKVFENEKRLKVLEVSES